ncbi:hypothetical protein SK803_20155 [Lentzea sp. BCCO 10_0856]|uniref:Uncharacterized protein n=1 Tax=Lentzea miocenica TaxID=3095431 RepID=A0ABU4T308_9PSEU|nr:hypothetical protein [Lentzea sp. BCCO 10_0856]MDX8032533.1 hypothetical protein [Lentzea sp. BCCO 10_0856]
MEYTRHDLAQAVLDAHPDSKRGLDMFRGGFSDDMKAHQVRLRDGLLKAFGIDLKADMALFMMLRATLDSNAAVRGPMSTFGEAGLLLRKLEGTGVLDRVNQIGELNVRSRELHFEIVEELIGLMGPTVEKVTSEDLKAMHVDDTPPNPDDYEIDY